ncbi:MAG: ATP-binding cassette domain-containing protein [Clostridia bacterium]|nr:ATP-binding cassette domain-containing protein [Clostridia bacterium]
MLKIEKLNVNIENKEILSDVSFEVKSGEIVVITGSNGSGKTTLLETIMGITPAKSGKIILNGQDISALNISQRAKKGVALAFQHPTLFKGLTVQNLLEISNKNAKKLDFACECLSQVGLCARDYLNREFNSSLSGGERKRIELATVLALNAKLNLFDEPESGIDMWSFDNLISIFENLKKQGKTAIIVSHNKKIMESADQVIVLEKGKILHSGKPKDVLKHISTSSCIKLTQTGGENGIN